MDVNQGVGVLPAANATITAGHGSQFQPIYMGRKMKIYPVYDSDLESLETFSDLATIAIGTITLIVGFALNIAWDAYFSGADSPKRVYGAPVVLIAIVFVAGAAIGLYFALTKKTGVRRRIEKESYEIGPGR